MRFSTGLERRFATLFLQTPLARTAQGATVQASAKIRTSNYESACRCLTPLSALPEDTLYQPPRRFESGLRKRLSYPLIRCANELEGPGSATLPPILPKVCLVHILRSPVGFSPCRLARLRNGRGRSRPPQLRIHGSCVTVSGWPFVGIPSTFRWLSRESRCSDSHQRYPCVKRFIDEFVLNIELFSPRDEVLDELRR